MTDVFIVPREGVLVRDPITKIPLSAKGMKVSLASPRGTYWRRRINCGDVLIVEESTMIRAKTKKVKEG